MKIFGLDFSRGTTNDGLAQRNYDSFFEDGKNVDLVETKLSKKGAFYKLPAVFGAFRLITSRIATLPIRVLNADGTETDIPQFLVRPNSYTSPSELISGIVHSLLEDGNAFVYVAEVNGRPVGLAAVPPRQVAITSEGGELVYRINGERVERGLIHFKYHTTPGALRGVGPLTPLGVTVQAAEAGLLYIRDSWLKGALTQYAAISKNALNKQEKILLTAQLRAAHQGLKNAFSPVVLDNSADIKQLSLSPQQSQLIETTTWIAATILGQAFNVAPSLLGVDTPHTSLTYSNEVDKDRALYTGVLHSIIRTIEEGLSALLPEGQTLDLDERDLLFGGPRDRANIANTMADVNQKTGFVVFLADEIRDVLGYEAVYGNELPPGLGMGDDGERSDDDDDDDDDVDGGGLVGVR